MPTPRPSVSGCLGEIPGLTPEKRRREEGLVSSFSGRSLRARQTALLSLRFLPLPADEEMPVRNRYSPGETGRIVIFFQVWEKFEAFALMITGKQLSFPI